MHHVAIFIVRVPLIRRVGAACRVAESVPARVRDVLQPVPGVTVSEVVDQRAVILPLQRQDVPVLVIGNTRDGIVTTGRQPGTCYLVVDGSRQAVQPVVAVAERLPLARTVLPRHRGDVPVVTDIPREIIPGTDHARARG